ncbi:MAG: VIT1/CCC1 transporter family protein [Atopobiaceae bacterium]|jgi:VIT1/CCC1 family predicted Fe2+/Mn2+ transporter|nr:VIT1/CCC1 transporter family protein [Atopobiaceae bacterium]
MEGAVFLVRLLTVVFGFTFTLKYLEKGEQLGQEGYERLARELPEAARMHDDERRHEAELESMLDEERLHYVGAMVLGLNDALVELTGAIAGVTFSLANTRLVALTGIVTGIAATLSMAASNYLAETAEGAGRRRQGRASTPASPTSPRWRCWSCPTCCSPRTCTWPRSSS